MKQLRAAVMAALAMAGILLETKSLTGRIVLALLPVVFLLNQWLMTVATPHVAMVYFLIVFTNRYVFLFLSFIRNGIAERLIERFGEDQGFEIYKSLTALMFFQGASGLTCLISHTSWTVPLAGHEHLILQGGGILLSAAGFIVNLWSTLVVGIDTYYYKDLFVGRFTGEFRREGPYRIFSNPMYGPGQLGGYGAAVMAGSLAGVIATVMNQAMMYAFYAALERPHIMRLLASEKAPTPGRTSADFARSSGLADDL